MRSQTRISFVRIQCERGVNRNGLPSMQLLDMVIHTVPKKVPASGVDLGGCSE